MLSSLFSQNCRSLRQFFCVRTRGPASLFFRIDTEVGAKGGKHKQ